MYKLWVPEFRKYAEEIAPYQFSSFAVRPMAMLNGSFSSLDPKPNQIVKVPIGIFFDIPGDASASSVQAGMPMRRFYFHGWPAHAGMVIFSLACLSTSCGVDANEGVRQLEYP